MQTRVFVKQSVGQVINGFELCFQKCVYAYEDATQDEGYRFIWRKPDGGLLAHRGQARIPSKEILMDLVNKADQDGMFA